MNHQNQLEQMANGAMFATIPNSQLLKPTTASLVDTSRTGSRCSYHQLQLVLILSMLSSSAQIENHHKNNHTNNELTSKWEERCNRGYRLGFTPTSSWEPSDRAVAGGDEQGRWRKGWRRAAGVARMGDEDNATAAFRTCHASSSANAPYHHN
jgi:hypothetical protein